MMIVPNSLLSARLRDYCLRNDIRSRGLRKLVYAVAPDIWLYVAGEVREVRKREGKWTISSLSLVTVVDTTCARRSNLLYDHCSGVLDMACPVDAI
jgi:hypothetical protein